MSVPDEERTQPTEDILNTLRQLSGSQQGSQQPPQALAQQGSQHSEEQNISQRVEQDVSSASSPVQSEWDILRARVRETPRDADAWMKLVDYAESTKDIDKITETYEALLEAYPNTVSSPMHCGIAREWYLTPQTDLTVVRASCLH